MYNFIVYVFHCHKPSFFYFNMVCLILLFDTFSPLVVRYLIHFLLLADIFPISILEIMPHLSFVLLKYKKREKAQKQYECFCDS